MESKQQAESLQNFENSILAKVEDLVKESEQNLCNLQTESENSERRYAKINDKLEHTIVTLPSKSDNNIDIDYLLSESEQIRSTLDEVFDARDKEITFCHEAEQKIREMPCA